MITNFGGNLRFTPRHLYTPATEAEVLAILDRHAHGKIRVVGALHSWSPAVVCADALLDLRHFDTVLVQRDTDGAVWATVGGGCRIKHLLRRLRYLAGATLPSIGLITEQTIAGAIATGTHGSGRHSLSHYIAELRVAAYDAATGKAHIYTWNDGDELRAARCAIGCLGVVLAVRLRCVPGYDVAETMVSCANLNAALARERKNPLQQFYLVPHRWTYFVQERRALAGARPRRSWFAQFYRAYWFLAIDVGLHAVIKLLADDCKSPALVRWFFRHVLPLLTLMNRTVIDRDDRMLVMEHELFQHLELEVFVPARNVRRATAFVRGVLEVFDGVRAAPDDEVAAALTEIGMSAELVERRGSFTHHYPVTFRRVLPDDTLISMASGTEEAYYAISFITYAVPRDDFFALASFLARSMTRLFQARLHWGKHFPLGNAEIDAAYPGLPRFRAICRQVDPQGVFRNEFVERVLFGSSSEPGANE